MIFHGKTFTSKVSLREVCQAIAKYAFVTSPYPVIISAEIHCGLTQLNMMVEIMVDVFGEALVRAPLDGHPKIELLPSPEELKGKVLLKVRISRGGRPATDTLQAKNLHLSPSESPQANDAYIDTESSTAETSTSSDTEGTHPAKAEWRKARVQEAEALTGE